MMHMYWRPWFHSAMTLDVHHRFWFQHLTDKEKQYELNEKELDHST